LKTVSSELTPDRGARRPTMRDVAAVAGVSLATVSRVVNGSGGVRPDLAEKVHAAVALLGYRRDLTATILRRADRLSAIIGLVLEDVANPFFAAVHRGVEEVARGRGVLTLTGSSDAEPARERELVEAFMGRRVDGLVVATSSPDDGYLAREREAGVPLVFVDRPPRFLDADAVRSDSAGGARDAVAHLIAAGHRRIAFLGDRMGLFTAQDRLRGYERALAERGIAPDPALVHTDLTGGVGVQAVIDGLLALPDPPTAVFAGQNLITIATVRALRAHGRHRDVALVGFDEVVLADALEPALTVVAQDPVAMGRHAAELLFARLAGETGPTREVVLPTVLIARGSGELPPPGR
jgi:LacI family transcriptional regulator